MLGVRYLSVIEVTRRSDIGQCSQEEEEADKRAEEHQSHPLSIQFQVRGMH